MSLMVGIISYLPDSELRTQRFAASCTQLELLHTLFSDVKIVSVCQNYDDSECKYEYVEYIRYKNGIGAALARNILLKYFYESDYDWMLLCDDDTIFYPYYSYENFMLDVAFNESKFRQIDAISAVEPEYHAFKSPNYNDRANLTHYKFEPRELNSGSATSFIRNIKKYKDMELYYPDVDANKGEGREDVEFLLEWLKAGLNWYTMDTWIRKSLAFDKSSIFGYNVKERDKTLMICLDSICRKYKDDGLSRSVKGKITWANFNERYNTSKRILYIQRDKPIEFEPEVIPKSKTKSKKLF